MPGFENFERDIEHVERNAINGRNENGNQKQPLSN